MLIHMLLAWRRFRRWRNFRRNVAELAAIDDRTLRDIGMSRTEILYEAWRHRR